MLGEILLVFAFVMLAMVAISVAFGVAGSWLIDHYFAVPRGGGRGFEVVPPVRGKPVGARHSGGRR